MKVRKSTAAPCRKKGRDNHRRSFACECKKACEALKWFKELHSPGVENYKLMYPESGFDGCYELEQFLLNDYLLRYESREKSGLEVLFNGIDRVHGITSDSINADNMEGLDFSNGEMDIAEAVSTYSYEVNNRDPVLYDDRGESNPGILDDINKVTSEIGEGEAESANEQIGPNLFADEDTVGLVAHLGFGHSKTHELFSAAPDNLKEVVFNNLYRQGVFESYEDKDLKKVAQCMVEKRDNKKDIMAIWPRYTEKRYIKKRKLIQKIIRDKGPFWAKRFPQIWKMLTPSQEEAIRHEFFHGEIEKPTQKESAAKLGISIASYQERLEWAFKKIESIFPEFKRVRRRKKAA